MSGGEQMIIGITDTLKPNIVLYQQWVLRCAPHAELVRLSPSLKNAGEVERCDGLLLSGGGDVHPRHYGREDSLRMVRGVDEERDEFEFRIVQMARTAGTPVLAICRGMQLLNVALGGSLIPDVEGAGFQNHRKDEGDVDRLHDVTVVPGTLLHSLVGCERGNVNSAHHQAVDRLGAGLRVAATSPDGLVEAAVWQEPRKHPFLLMVQWHPERMKEFMSAFSQNIVAGFVKEIARSMVTQKHLQTTKEEE